jgi:hypothetical protein
MTDEELKAAARRIIKVFVQKDWLWCVDDTEQQEATDVLFSQLQPLVEADRETLEKKRAGIRDLVADVTEYVAKIERYKKALQEIATENKAGLAQGIASTALGEEE